MKDGSLDDGICHVRDQQVAQDSGYFFFMDATATVVAVAVVERSRVAGGNGSITL